MPVPEESALLIDTSTPPDVMNDPQFATNRASGDDGTNDADTCRICRGEGSDAEPLFHPCKCSGSIKHVHQDCLMEWLSHSQKKHCELCKTPFRFTKLYSPNMPSSLPNSVFIRHFLVHTARNLATWLRLCMVITVWLGCLPYVIRQVWRLLFWFSDGIWPSNYLDISGVRNSTTSEASEMIRQLEAANLLMNGTTPVIPFNPSQTTPASVGGVLKQLADLFSLPFSQIQNGTRPDPLSAGLWKTLYYGLGINGVMLPEGSPVNITTSNFVLGTSSSGRNSSLLSDISFFQNLTSNPYLNQLIITIVEGYVITILVVVSFILVFLIREWVVQQQPGINMGAGFNAEFGAADRARDPPAPPEAVPRDLDAPGEPAQRPIARLPRRRNQGDPAILAGIVRDRPDAGEGRARPAPARNAFTPAVDIQRQLTEEPRLTEEFLAIWRRADSDPEEVLRIIESEHRESEMGYWVNAMKSLHNTAAQEKIDGRLDEPAESSYVHASGGRSGSDQGSASGESWVDVPKSTRDVSDNGRSLINDKASSEASQSTIQGKGKAQEPLFGPEVQPLPSINKPDSPQEEVLDIWRNVKQGSQNIHSPSGRPRATSDGPQFREGISPLASNSWSFKNISDDNDDAQVERPRPETRDSKAWKAAQDLRVQQAIMRGREAQNVSLGERAPPLAPSSHMDPNSSRSDVDSDHVSRDRGDVLAEDTMGESEEEEHEDDDEPDIFQADGPLPDAREPVVARAAEPQGLLGYIADWLWEDIHVEHAQEEGANDEHVVEDVAAEAPFVPVARRDLFDGAGDPDEQDPEVLEAAIAAGIDPNDPDAIDDAEDFEGIMELVGMRGPIFSLVQNALFSAFLLALTVAFGVWLPYNFGRVVLLVLANPGPTLKLPLKLIFWSAAFLQDLVVSAVGLISWSFIAIWSWPLRFGGFQGMKPLTLADTWGSTSWNFSADAVDRILDGAFKHIFNFSNSDLFAFSAASHESLNLLRNLIIKILDGIGSRVIFLFTGDYNITFEASFSVLSDIVQQVYSLVANLPAYFARPESWVISLEVTKRSAPLDLELSVWDGIDRFWAIVTGYSALGFIGALYVKKGSPFSTGQVGREWEASIIDLLHQAGGVLKVILIISIEMLVFPLYCGLLLDAALLPLFEGATIMTRILFTLKSPLTSIFVHWFVGTCYMFHFALFVSMCRKIMRKGVLYFIRDPDDPTFHPVRDVLERNVATQLRKILFSALVYGALVVVCLGGVVWGLSHTFKGILPIHWSSNEPVLEFPVDLLFYNFLMPLAVKFFKPSDGLHAMYSWWFRQCARMLRLTWFMFDERRLDEEGEIIRRSWISIVQGVKNYAPNPVKADEPDISFAEHPDIDAFVRRDGRYARVPASDQVRIPKGARIFLEVDEYNNRVDGKWDRPDGVHGRDEENFKQVYIPPWFRVRIFLFILSIWIFAALTGVCITILPLVFGRHVFSKIIPPHIRKNDVYAFSIGIYVLGSALYLILHLRHLFQQAISSVSINADTPRAIARHVSQVAIRMFKIAWTYGAVLLLLPTLFAFVIEFYAIVPLHTYFAPLEPHTIHFVQSWTLGLLYVKLTTRLIQFYPDSRAAHSLRAITRRGYLDPDARIATKSFILPATLVLSTALTLPWTVAKLFVYASSSSIAPENQTLVFRYIYPAFLAAAGLTYFILFLGRCLKGWRMRIRDEVYLIGERLHNFGERKSGPGNNIAIGVRRIDT